MSVLRRSAEHTIVVSGTGMLTPYGSGFEPFLQGFQAGTPAWGPLSAFDCTTWPVRHGGWISDPTSEVLGTFNNKLRNMGKYVRLGVLAAGQALAAASVTPGVCPPERQGAFICTGTYGHNAEGLFPAFSVSGASDGTLDLGKFGDTGIDRVHPWWLLSTISNNLIFFITHFFQLKGPNSNYCNSALAGFQALARACESLREGEIDIALVGGADSPLNWQLMSDFYAMGFLAEEDGCGPPPASFSTAARGAILSDGAGFLVLETAAHAQKRGVRPLAVVADFAQAAFHSSMIHPSADGKECQAVFQALLNNVSDDEPVQLHLAGVGHPSWDIAELDGLSKSVCKRGSEKLSIGCPRAWTGHSFSASFIVDSVCAIEAMRHQIGVSPGPGANRITEAGFRPASPQEPHRSAIVSSLCFGGDAAGVIYDVV